MLSKNNGKIMYWYIGEIQREYIFFLAKYHLRKWTNYEKSITPPPRPPPPRGLIGVKPGRRAVDSNTPFLQDKQRELIKEYLPVQQQVYMYHF